MKLPSIEHILAEASKSFLRFPFSIVSSVLATATAIYLVELDFGEETDQAIKLLMISVLGISLFTVTVLTSEKHVLGRRLTLMAQGAGVLLLVIYFFSLPENMSDAVGRHGVRYALYFLGLHLLVAYLPFAGSDELNGFWQYNKTLFLRLLTGVLYSGVLFIGLSVALLAIDNLFGANIHDELYADLWCILVGIFNTWFFLSGVPDDLETLEQRDDYPRGLKVFTQYVLIPLVIIYLLILYGYALKIVIEWSWPEGWVANLVLGFSIVGIFALLLLHPIRNRVEHAWVKTVSRYYYIVLLPLVVLLLLAIWVRISEYSFTENRYFVLVAGIWLGAIALYLIISSGKNIKTIPASLAAIVFLSSFGPWGAFSISEKSQINRLEELLRTNEILSEGTVGRTSADVPFEDSKEISAIFRYLAEMHGLRGVRPWFGEDSEAWDRVTGDDENGARYQQAQKIVEELGLVYINRWENADTITRSFNTSEHELVPVEPYDWLIGNLNLNTSRDTVSLAIDGASYRLELEADRAGLTLYHGEDTDDLRVLTSIPLGPVINRLGATYTLSNSYNIPAGEMELTGENDSLAYKLLIRNMVAVKSDDDWTIQNLQLTLLLTIRERG